MSLRISGALPRKWIWILAVAALPFLGLLAGSRALIQSNRAAFASLAHSTAWSLEISRHLENLELVHEGAGRLLQSRDPAAESAVLDAALDRLVGSRRELALENAGQPDPFLPALDQDLDTYLALVARVRGLALARPHPGPAAQADLKEGLDHLHRGVLASFRALERFHRERQAAAAQDSRLAASQLSLFAGTSLVVALALMFASGLFAYQRHQRLRASQFTRALFYTIPDAVLAWNRAGVVLGVNPGLEALLGVPGSRAWQGAHLGELLPGQSVHRLEAAGSGTLVRLNLVHADGSLRVVEARVGRTGPREDGACIAVMRDVTGQLERERRLVEFRWQIRLGRQVASILRDLDHALNPLFLALDLLQAGRPDDPGRKDIGQALGRSAERANLLLAQFNRLAAGTEASGESRIFDLQACLDEVVECIRIDRLAGIQVDADPPAGLVRGPAGLVRRCLELLLQRAVDAAEGKVQVRVRCGREAGFAVVRVLDPGRGSDGIDPALMLEPAYCHEAGPGEDPFGLFNVAQSMKTLGGSAEVRRLADGWIEFTLKFPLAESRPE